MPDLFQEPSVIRNDEAPVCLFEYRRRKYQFAACRLMAPAFETQGQFKEATEIRIKAGMVL